MDELSASSWSRRSCHCRRRRCLCIIVAVGDAIVASMWLSLSRVRLSPGWRVPQGGNSLAKKDERVSSQRVKMQMALPRVGCASTCSNSCDPRESPLRQVLLHFYG